MPIKQFEDLVAWQKAQDFAVQIFSECQQIPDYAFRSQIWRATISISNNLAEGFDRSSKADFRRFAYMALGSSSEVKSMIYLAKRIGYFEDQTHNTLQAKVTEVSKIISGLIKSLTTDY